MAVSKKEIKAFVSGTHNLIDDELIPRDAASESLGWLTKDGRIELMYGRQAHGDEGTAGKMYGQHVGYKTDGTAVFFRKKDTIVQYLDGDTWTDIITGLTASDMTFTNYSSLAGNATYITSPDDGLFKIMTANPGSYADMYDSTKNFKGFSFIDKGRMMMWNTADDTTGLYGSHIDAQDSDVYTTVSAEALAAVETGTLAFKAGGSTRTCFAVEITDTSSGEVFSDNYDGTLTGDSGGTGTINYMTGAFTITGQTGAGTADYQWVDDNTDGVTDFTKSATRVAGEGFTVRQDAGGDAIKVVVPFDGSYFSFKANSVYKFTLNVDDTNPTNELFLTNVGVESLRSAVGTSSGIVFLNTGNPSKPVVNILERNPVGDNFNTRALFPQFKFENYTYSDVLVDSWDKFIIMGCKEDSNENNRLLMCDMREKTVDVAPYGIRTSCKDDGFLYGGDPVASTCYEMFTGFDDMGLNVQNVWTGSGDHYGKPDALKKTKKFRMRGKISPDQSIKVSVSRDNGEWQHVGTILGSGDYVDYNTSYAIGTIYIGQDTIGGGDSISAYTFLMELKVRLSKFRKRQIRFEAEGMGYCAMQSVTDWDIWEYENRVPKGYRTKQNVSLDGATTDEASPTY